MLELWYKLRLLYIDMKIYLLVILLGLAFIGSTKTAQAIPPPDFIFQIGSQIVQIFTFIVLGSSVLIGSLRRYFQTHPIFLRFGKLAWVVLALVVLAISLGSAYFYAQYKQNKEYTNWVEQSKQQDQNITFENSGDNLDKLKVGEIRGENPGDLNDKGAQFVKTYYGYLNSGNTRAAYDISSKIVDYPTYASWYKDTTSVSIDSIQKIDENKYSLGLTLKERSGAITRYAVLMQLNNTNGTYTVKHSDVRVLAENTNNDNTVAPEDNQNQDTSFFENNSSIPLSISNDDFAKIPSNAFVLDAREDEEYEIGYYPGSHHLRFADIKAGEWITLLTDQPIYVLCWSGIRGKEVADFLRSKKILARYVDKGADGWVAYGGKWVGGIKFRSTYSADQYKVVFTTDQVREYVKQGVVIVDSRNAEKYKRRHIPGSVSIPIIYTPSSKINEVLSQVPPNSTVITVCDDFVSCFDATVTGVKLEKRGNTFLGRYNKPWEY